MSAATRLITGDKPENVLRGRNPLLHSHGSHAWKQFPFASTMLARSPMTNTSDAPGIERFRLHADSTGPVSRRSQGNFPSGEAATPAAP